MSEYLHVENPFLYQLATLGWTMIDQSVGVIPKILKVMQENGSPAPEFESDDDRTHFLIRLPVHSRAPRLTTGEVTPQVTQQVGTKSGPSANSSQSRAGQGYSRIDGATGTQQSDQVQGPSTKPSN